MTVYFTLRSGESRARLVFSLDHSGCHIEKEVMNSKEVRQEASKGGKKLVAWSLASSGENLKSGAWRSLRHQHHSV